MPLVYPLTTYGLRMYRGQGCHLLQHCLGLLTSRSITTGISSTDVVLLLPLSDISLSWVTKFKLSLEPGWSLHSTVGSPPVIWHRFQRLVQWHAGHGAVLCSLSECLQTSNVPLILNLSTILI